MVDLNGSDPWTELIGRIWSHLNPHLGKLLAFALLTSWCMGWWWVFVHGLDGAWAGVIVILTVLVITLSIPCLLFYWTWREMKPQAPKPQDDDILGI